MTVERFVTKSVTKRMKAVIVGVLATSITGAGVGCDGASSMAVLTGGPPSGLAVVGSDFTSTSVSLVAADGTLAKDDCINSGTQAGGKLSLTLSGDVTLPSRPQRPGELWLIDRANAALTVLDPTTCDVRAQISVGTGFKSNPHDIVVVSDTKAYVTRYEKNVSPQSANDIGDDILIINPGTGTVTGRIDLGPSAAPVTDVDIQARPDRMVLADGKVFVSLGSQDAMFLNTGEGRLVVVDPTTDKVATTVSLTGLKGCSALHHLAATKTLFVACGGSFADADQAAGSGIAEVDLNADPPVLARVTRAGVFGGQPVNFSWVGAVSPTRAFAATLGTFPDPKNNVPGTMDGAFAFDPVAGTSTSLIAGGPFDLGRAAVGSATLFLPDAKFDAPRIHVFDVLATGAPTERVAFDPEPSKGLPPREIAWY